MFIRSKKDVETYTKNIYTHIFNSKGQEYIDFIQNLLNQCQNDQIRNIFKIVIADIYDYFCEHEHSNNFDEAIYENTSVRKINECVYICDDAFIEYTINKYILKHQTDDANLMYILKSILLSIKDVNSNICYALQHNKNKDADEKIKYIIYKYTDANIKITQRAAEKAGIKVDKSISIDEFYELYFIIFLHSLEILLI